MTIEDVASNALIETLCSRSSCRKVALRGMQGWAHLMLMRNDLLWDRKYTVSERTQLELSEKTSTSISTANTDEFGVGVPIVDRKSVV